ncbi:MAG: hypothetical protein K6F50_09820 [Kiritimatiellae bacterium]|nr:hypothetical protein [Kiritimatiellia bacterium]
MSTDYIVASLPVLAFGAGAPISWDAFAEKCGGDGAVAESLEKGGWPDIETQLRNAVAEARGGAKYKRRAEGCSIFWKNRVLAAFQEKDVARRDELLDRVWWDAAGELTPPASPLGEGALRTYAVRLKIALRRAMISEKAGGEAFDRLTAETKR